MISTASAFFNGKTFESSRRAAGTSTWAMIALGCGALSTVPRDHQPPRGWIHQDIGKGRQHRLEDIGHLGRLIIAQDEFFLHDLQRVFQGVQVHARSTLRGRSPSLLPPAGCTPPAAVRR